MRPRIARAAIAVRDIATDSGQLSVTVETGAIAVAPLLRALDAAGLAVSSVTVTRPSLDDVFLTLTGHALREGFDELVPTA